MFRVTQIDLDGGEEISVLYAVADSATAEVIRPFTDPAGFDCRTGTLSDGTVRIRLTIHAAHDILEVTGKIPGDNPHWPLTTIVNNSLFGIISSLEGW
jgi:hypothetical protein